MRNLTDIEDKQLETIIWRHLKTKDNLSSKSIASDLSVTINTVSNIPEGDLIEIVSARLNNTNKWRHLI